MKKYLLILILFFASYSFGHLMIRKDINYAPTSLLTANSLIAIPGAGTDEVVNVSFRANMAVQMKKGAFNPVADSLYVRGNFQMDAGDVADWQGYTFKLIPATSGDSIYTKTVSLPLSIIGKAMQYKFVKNDIWETSQPSSSGNREFTLAASDMILPVGYFNNDSIYIYKPKVKMTINFTADMSNLLGTGFGNFDPTADSIQVMGLDWEGQTMIAPVNRTLKRDSLSPNLYRGQLTVQSEFGDIAKWKFKAYPDARFANNGWESGAEHNIAFPSQDSTITLPVMVPAITVFPPPIGPDVTVLFQVDMNHSPINAKTGQVIPLNSIQWMGVKGSAFPLGSWMGNWTASDTLITREAPSMIVLVDDGTRGDLKAGDHIYSRNILFRAGTPAGEVVYKYACSIKGQDTGSAYLDNEAPAGFSHMFKLAVPANGNVISLFNQFGPYPETLLSLTSPNGGENWTAESSHNITWNGYGITAIDIAYSTNNGSDWITVTTNQMANTGSYSWTVPNTPSSQCKVKISAAGNSTIRSFSTGTFTISSLAETSRQTYNTEKPLDYELRQNFPNPFNPSTTIRFGLPEKTMVTLTVFNQLGQRVTLLAQETMDRGYHTVSWNAANMPTGIYFYELKTEKFTSVKKLLLLK